jgi:hypothetical protein
MLDHSGINGFSFFSAKYSDRASGWMLDKSVFGGSFCHFFDMRIARDSTTVSAKEMSEGALPD